MVDVRPAALDSQFDMNALLREAEVRWALLPLRRMMTHRGGGQVLRSLRHENIILLRDVFTPPNFLVLSTRVRCVPRVPPRAPMCAVTELVAGGELFGRVEKGSYEEPRARVCIYNTHTIAWLGLTRAQELMRRILRGVKYLHDRNMYVHSHGRTRTHTSHMSRCARALGQRAPRFEARKHPARCGR